jgi:integrase
MTTPTAPGTSKRKTCGLLLRNEIWHIDKVLFGKRVCESTHTRDRQEAENLLAHRVSQARRAHLYGEAREFTFREAVSKYLHDFRLKRSIARDIQALKAVDPFIGHLLLKHVHHGSLQPYVRFRLDKGQSPGTVNRETEVVRRILNLASRVWRDDTGRAWLPVPPQIPRIVDGNARQPFPLSVAEQRLLFSELDEHLRTMALFKVNTGLREKEVTNLKWEWELEVPELETSIFVIPREYTKTNIDRYVVLNRIARTQIESCRGKHPEFVFTLKGSPITKIYNSGWKGARRRAALRYQDELGRECPKGFQSIRVHDMKHSFGHRLRCVGVDWEDRKVLLGHKVRDCTTHYSAAEIGHLIAASEKVCDLVSSGSPAVSVVRKPEPRTTASLVPSKKPPSRAVAKREGAKSDLPVVLPISVAIQAAEYAEADGISLDQFISTAVAERIRSLHAARLEVEASLQFRNTARQPMFNTLGSPILRRDDLEVPRCRLYQRPVLIDAAS